MKNLSNANRYGLILLVLFISMSFCGKQAKSNAGQDLLELSESKQDKSTEEVPVAQAPAAGPKIESRLDLSKGQLEKSTEETSVAQATAAGVKTENILDLPESQQEKSTEEVPVAQAPAAGSKTENREVIVTQLFQIKNLGIDEAKEKIKELLSKDEKTRASVEILIIPRPGEDVNFLVVKDTPTKIQEIAQVIGELEKKFAPVTIDLDFTDVPLSQILAAIAQTTDLNIIGGETLSEKISVRLKDVPLTDAFDIILKSTAYTHLKEGKIVRIVPKKEVPFATEVFELRYISAERMREAVSHLISKEGNREGNVKVFSKFSKGEFSNVLIVTDTEETLEAVRRLVNKLDKRAKQVMIEAKFCEVTFTKDNELGIDWVIAASLKGAAIETTFPFNSLGTALQGRVLKLPQEVDETGTSTFTSTWTMGNVSFNEFNATLHALDKKTKINIVSNPRIATKEGEEAGIVIGDRIPIPIYERMAQTGLMVVSGYQQEQVGVLLKVTPIINPDNTITLKIHPEVSEITGYTGPNDERPIVSTRQIDTIFTMESGKTVVLGGLKKQTVNTTVKKVPFLGNVPGLGKFFTYKDDSDERKELLIFITPNILEETAPQEVTALDK